MTERKPDPNTKPKPISRYPESAPFVGDIIDEYPVADYPKLIRKLEQIELDYNKRMASFSKFLQFFKENKDEFGPHAKEYGDAWLSENADFEEAFKIGKFGFSDVIEYLSEEEKVVLRGGNKLKELLENYYKRDTINTENWIKKWVSEEAEIFSKKEERLEAVLEEKNKAFQATVDIEVKKRLASIPFIRRLFPL